MSWIPAARDGILLAAGACALIVALMKLNPRLFLRHFPEPLRSRAEPLTPSERRAGRIGALLLMTWVLGVLVTSTLAAEARGGRFVELALHAFLVGSIFNLADWLLLDELWLGLGRGAGLLPADFRAAAGVRFDHRKHAADFLRGSLVFALLALAVAGGVALL